MNHVCERPISEQVLNDFVAGTLSDEVEEQIATHLDDCPSCLQMLHSMNEAIRGELYDSEPMRAGKTIVQDSEPPHWGSSDSALPDGDEPNSEFDDRQLRSRLRFVGPIHQGGIGEVRICQDVSLNRLVAVKSLKKEQVSNPQSALRFRREYEVTCRVDHPGVPTVFGRGRNEDGSEFYAMQYIQGPTLAEKIAEFHAGSNHQLVRTNPEFAGLLEALIAVCDALSTAHQAGILHRDIKPLNVVFNQSQLPILVDWGLAGFTNSSEVDENEADVPTFAKNSETNVELTQDNRVLGSILWISPEQARGETRKLNEQTDVYGLGAMLFHVMVGYAPHSVDAGGWGTEEGAHPSQKLTERLQRIGSGRVPSMQRTVNGVELPSELKSICRVAMHPDQDQRFHSADELAAELRAWLTSAQIDSHQYSWGEILSRKVTQNPLVTLMSAGMLAVSILLLWTFSSIELREKNARLESSEAVKEQLLNVISQKYRDFSERAQRIPDPGEQVEKYDITERVMAGQFALELLEVEELQSEMGAVENALERARIQGSLASLHSIVEEKDLAANFYRDAFQTLDDIQLEQSPEHIDVLLDKSQLANSLSSLLRMQGKTDESLQWIQTASFALQEATQLASNDDEELARELTALAISNGQALIERGLRQQALEACTIACQSIPAKFVCETTNQGLHDMAWVLRQDVIMNLVEMHRHADAIPFLDELKQIQDSSPRGASANKTHELDTVRILTLESDLLSGMGKVEASHELLDESIHTIAKLLEQFPEDLNLVEKSASIENKFARDLIRLERYADAVPHLQRDCELTQLLIERSDGSNEALFRDYAFSLQKLAENYVQLDRHADAKDCLTGAIETLVTNCNPFNRKNFISLENALSARAQIARKQQDWKNAIADREQIVAAGRQFIEREPGNLKNIENVARNLYFMTTDVMSLKEEVEGEQIEELLEEAILQSEELKQMLDQLIARLDSGDYTEPTSEPKEGLEGIRSLVIKRIAGLEQALEASNGAGVGAPSENQSNLD